MGMDDSMFSKPQRPPMSDVQIGEPSEMGSWCKRCGMALDKHFRGEFPEIICPPAPSPEPCPTCGTTGRKRKCCQPKPEGSVREFDKVDRALEAGVIDWLQWAEFPQRLDKPSMPALALELIAKRKSAYDRAVEVARDQATRADKLAGEIEELKRKLAASEG